MQDQWFLIGILLLYLAVLIAFAVTGIADLLESRKMLKRFRTSRTRNHPGR